jgi:hypothetical protein
MPDATACPVGFVSGTTGQCVPACPSSDGLDNRIVNGEPRCVYRQDETKFFALKQSPIVPLTSATDFAPTLSWLQASRPAFYTSYKDAQDDFTTKKDLLLGQISTSKLVSDAFRELQAAENARGTNPQAYQDARIRYYTLTQGDAWVASERQRLLNAEVLPAITPYLQSINFLGERQTQQAGTKTAVDAVKSRLLTLKDDFRTTTTTLMKQVTELQNQIELQKRRSIAEVAAANDWYINVLIVVLSLVVIYILYRRIMGPAKPTPPKRPVSSSATSRGIQTSAYTSSGTQT